MGYTIKYVGKKKCDVRHFPWHLLVLLTLMSGLLGGCRGQEDPELLKFIADGYEANLELLRTWRGTAIRRVGKSSSKSSNGSMPLNFKEETVERLKFVADRDKDAASWYGIPVVKKDPDSESKPQWVRVNSGMNKGKYYYRMDVMREPEQYQRHERILLVYGAVSHGIQLDEFDPVWVLIHDLGAHGTMGEGLRKWAEAIENKIPPPEGAGYNIERNGDVVTIKFYGRDDESEGGGIFRSSYAFDISKGCSMVGQHHVSSRSETHWELDYEEHNGVFVPREISHVHRNKDGGLHHHIVFTTEMVNKPVSESEFTYEALGLRPGDHIVDHTKGGETSQCVLTPGTASPSPSPNERNETIVIEIGDIAPGFNSVTTDGEEFRLSQLRGKYILLDFWATWCAPCIYEMPNLKKAHSKYGPNGLEVIGIGIGDPEEHHIYIQKKKLEWKEISDKNNNIRRMYHVSGVPSLFLVDPMGVVVSKGTELRGNNLMKTLEKHIKRAPEN